MLITLRKRGRGRAALWRLGSALALLAQCWIAVAAFGDARGFGAAAHVEASGISLHWAHDAADCAACRTLALSALPLHAAVPLARVARPHTAPPAARPLPPRIARITHTRTRAPPSVA